jgi:hypothetical protein
VPEKSSGGPGGTAEGRYLVALVGIFGGSARLGAGGEGARERAAAAALPALLAAAVCRGSRETALVEAGGEAAR